MPPMRDLQLDKAKWLFAGAPEALKMTVQMVLTATKGFTNE